MSGQTSITRYEQIKSVMRSDEIVERFSEIVGGYNASAYISSVLIAVANSEKLQECDTKSILYSALRAATLRLSCDPSTKQAYLVPFKGKATLVIGAKGYHDMAIRTGKYRYIQVYTVREGMEVVEDIITGFHKVNIVGKVGDKAIGHLLSFALLSGYSKTFYMTVEEIHAHAAHYSASYSLPNSVWKSNPSEMERKTVLRLGLTRWGVFDPHDLAAMGVDDNEQEVVDVQLPEPTIPEPVTVSVSQTMGELGFGDDVKLPKTTPVAQQEGTGTTQHEQATLLDTPAMEYATAKDFKNHEGILYIDLDTTTLQFMATTLQRGITEHKYEHMDEAQLKLAAIKTILAKRAATK